MAEYRYVDRDRREQLERLVSGLRELIPVVAGLPDFAGLAPEYEAALGTAERLLRDGFRTPDLSALARSVPDAFYRHKEWEPPSEQAPSGEWREPEWFARLESKLQPLLQAAQELDSVGHY